MDSELPIFEIRDALVRAAAESNRIVLQAPTGSGKSTQVPGMLADAANSPGGQIIVLQPRRLAARMLATRVASERGCDLGSEVGYQIRLDNRSGAETRILYVTEGILLRRMQADPFLNGVSALVFDEFHERHLHGDISLARALDLQESTRPDLRLIVMSATLDGASVAEYLAPCRILESAGRTFPVDVEYARRAPTGEIWDAAAEAAAAGFPLTDGHALVFMPGAYEIRRTIEAIQRRLGSNVPVLPLHGELPADQQDAAVADRSDRRVIVSTNVAETSLTISGVTLVVDSGLARKARFDPRRGINTLYVEPISLASADQRSGRAGRTGPGRCVRLWTEASNRHRELRDEPEIKRLDLAEVVLGLTAAGVEDLDSFRWLDPPDPVALARATDLLRDLGALSTTNKITEVGRRMLSFPVHPRYARMFLAAGEQNCVSEAILIAALTQSRNLLLRADKRTAEARESAWGSANSDFEVQIRAFEWAQARRFRTDDCRPLGVHAETARQVSKLAEQFSQIARSEGLPRNRERASDEAIARCILAGFADHVAKRRGPGTLSCDLTHGRRGTLAKDSVATDSNLLVAASIDEIERRSGEADVALSLATGIDEAWLREMFPTDFSETSEVIFDATQKRVVERSAKMFHDLPLELKDRDAKPSAAASACLANEIFHGNLVLKQWDDEVEQLIRRVNCLADWFPDLGVAPISEADREILLTEICSGATSYREVKDRPVKPGVRGWLTAAQLAQFDRLVPERIELPGGRRAKVTYSEGASPVVAARIQDLYGVTKPILICAGRIACTIQVLAPNFRPVQITTDLANFWKESYPKLKLELQRRYPKHEWR
ncbi:MAG: ATP-dependent helicase HrpB [Chthoniobacterales bacterium]